MLRNRKLGLGDMAKGDRRKGADLKMSDFVRGRLPDE